MEEGIRVASLIAAVRGFGRLVPEHDLSSFLSTENTADEGARLVCCTPKQPTRHVAVTSTRSSNTTLACRRSHYESTRSRGPVFEPPGSCYMHPRNPEAGKKTAHNQGVSGIVTHTAYALPPLTRSLLAVIDNSSLAGTLSVLHLAREGPMAGLVRYVGVAGVGGRRVRRVDESVVPTGWARPLRHDAEVRKTVWFRAKNEVEQTMGSRRKMRQHVHTRNATYS